MDILPGKPAHLKDILHLYREFRGDGWKPLNLEKSLEDYPCVVAYEEGHLIGFAYTYRFAPDILELANIYVAPGHRNNRLGSDILQELEKDCAMEGFRGMILCNSYLYETVGEKKSPDSFYVRNGYHIVAATPDTTVFAKIF